jgi:hypothetical protein
MCEEKGGIGKLDRDTNGKSDLERPTWLKKSCFIPRFEYN